ncbi:MAG: hypothetical protein FWH46_01195 [Methanimicrococcus sp.]|nr:hypothetical protein [Methanimicrococcus sp.]
MKKEKIEQMRSRQKGKKIGDTIRTISIINLIVIGIGFLLFNFSTDPTLQMVGNGLVIAGGVSVFFTIVYQIIMTAKMRKESKK